MPSVLWESLWKSIDWLRTHHKKWSLEDLAKAIKIAPSTLYVYRDEGTIPFDKFETMVQKLDARIVAHIRLRSGGAIPRTPDTGVSAGQDVSPGPGTQETGAMQPEDELADFRAILDTYAPEYRIAVRALMLVGAKEMLERHGPFDPSDAQRAARTEKK